MAMTALLASLVGCLSGPSEMGQFGEEESIVCEETSRTPVLPEDTVEVGHEDALQSVLVSDVLESAAGTFTETLQWSDGSEAGVTATLAGAASPEVVTYEDVGSAFETEPVPGACATQLELTVDVTLTTTDGRMDDAFAGVARSIGDTVYVEHRITAPGGSIDVQALAQAGVDVEPDEVRVEMRMPQDDAFSGTLLPQPIGAIDDDAQFLGRWPAAELEE